MAASDRGPTRHRATRNNKQLLGGAAAAAVGDPGVADAGVEAAAGGTAPGADPMAQTLSAQPLMTEGSGEGGTTAPDRGGGAIEGAPVVLEQNISPGTV